MKLWLLYHTKLPLLGFLKYIEYICVPRGILVCNNIYIYIIYIIHITYTRRTGIPTFRYCIINCTRERKDKAR